MDKKFLITGVVCTVLTFLFSFLIHGVLLHGEYLQLPNLLRPEAEAQNYFHFMVIANIFIGFAFAWIYRQGITPGVPWLQQGIRFGVAAACLFQIPMYLIYYTIQPWPAAVVVKQIILETLSMIVTGIAAAYINKE